MVDVLVRKDYSAQDVQLADLKRVEFRRNRYTSGSAHLDDMIALQKALILCDSHARKFKPRAARYELHPAENMRTVVGNCDVCKMMGPGVLFLPQSQAADERKKREQYLRCLEYSTIVSS